MDTSDPDIKFNNLGICSNCEDVIFASKFILKNKDGKGFSLLENEINKIKSIQAKEKYDCIIGVSGGVDSSYLCLFLNDQMNFPYRFSLEPLINGKEIA